MKNTIYIYKKYIIIAIIVIITAPFVINYIIIANDFSSKGTNDGWLSFLGSYIGGMIGGIGTLLAVLITTKETRKIQKNYDDKEEYKIKNDELKKIINAVKTFENRVIGQYVDMLQSGKAYTNLKLKGGNGKTENEFIDVRNLFEDIELYNEGEYAEKYYKIKDFYDEKVYGQTEGGDFVFAIDYINLIEELGLDEKMVEKRSEYNK